MLGSKPWLHKGCWQFSGGAAVPRAGTTVAIWVYTVTPSTKDPVCQQPKRYPTGFKQRDLTPAAPQIASRTYF